MKRFADLNEQEILALAISNEDEDNRIYRSFADALAGVEGDQLAAGEHGLDHDQRSADGLLDQDAAVREYAG